jgi:Tfp pilus assembly protein PilN
MTNKQLEKVSWLLIYSGLLIGALGLFLVAQGSAMGPVLAGVGVLDAVAGIVMIWVRSRRTDKDPS